MAMTAKNMPYKHGFGPFPSEVYRAPLSSPFRDGDLGGPASAARSIEHLERHVGADNIAALVIEPIQGEGGFVVPAPGFLTGLAEWSRAHTIVFVLEEVQTGFARTGAMFASEHEGLVPDLIVTAKGIADGLPLAAVTGRADITDGPHTGGLGGTYGGNPVACAAALANLRTIREDGLVTHAGAIGETMRQRLQAVQAADPRLGDVRGRGAMIAIEIVRPSGTEPDPVTTKAIPRPRTPPGSSCSPPVATETCCGCSRPCPSMTPSFTRRSMSSPTSAPAPDDRRRGANRRWGDAAARSPP
jgi:4-aminobutyrate aminotransferase/(S)-3-amino-2-methylpropionate transaminase